MSTANAGKLSEQRTVPSVLSDIAYSATHRHVAVRIVSSDTSGRLGILDGKLITGAEIPSADLSGEEAVTRLLAVTKGMYHILNLTAEDFSALDQGLTLPLENEQLREEGVPFSEETEAQVALCERSLRMARS